MHKTHRQKSVRKKPRRYHVADSEPDTIEHELPDWLVGAD